MFEAPARWSASECDIKSATTLRTSESWRYSSRVLPSPASKTTSPFESCNTAEFPCPTSSTTNLGESIVRIDLRRQLKTLKKQVLFLLRTPIYIGQEIGTL